MRSEPSFWTAQRKRPLIRSKRPSPSLMSLVQLPPRRGRSGIHSTTSKSAAQGSLSRPQAPSERHSLPYLRVQNDPASRWPDASVAKDKEAIHCRGTNGKASCEGWVGNLELADVLSSNRRGRTIDPCSDVCCTIVGSIIMLEGVRC